MTEVEPNLWTETPLIRSSHISNLLGCSAYLKLENLQPSQSFKYRGLSLFAQRCKARRGASVHLIIASGGNAGLAAACAAHVLGVRCTVYITDGASCEMLDFLRKEGAEVVSAGTYYRDALARAEEAVRAEENAVMVPAYDDAVVWDGHSSMITEIARQLPQKPDAIFCSVGGGGLLGGVLVGCGKVSWDDVPVVAIETHGSNCFYHSVSVNPGQWNTHRALPAHVEAVHDANTDTTIARLSVLSSRATSLGASAPAAGAVRMALAREGGIKCVCVPDEMAMQAAASFAEDHKILIELACSTTLTAAYKSSLFSTLLPSASKDTVVVFIVCGGFKISLAEMEEYRDIVRADIEKGDSWQVLYNGEEVSVGKENRIKRALL